jgi:hypothetical protein
MKCNDFNQGCHFYIAGYEWWEETHRGEDITSELS